MHSHQKSKWSLYACLFGFVVMAFTSFVFYPRWKKTGTEATISYDVSGYYWYLPSIFIYHDLKGQGFKEAVRNKYEMTPDFQQMVQQPNGNYVMKYTAGMSTLYLPFFATGHAAAQISGAPTDGFSAPYQFFMQLGGLLVAIFGLWQFRRLLLIFYDDKVVAVSILLMVIGSNYLPYASINASMTHNWLFVLYVLLILTTIRFYDTFQVKYAVYIGLLVGYAIFIRPSELIACLIPLLWGLEDIKPATILARVRLLFSKFKLFVVAALCAVAIVSLQLVYWKYASGHWLVYSYGDQHLYFRSPNFYNYTLSAQTGWLRYSPIMVLAFVGLLPFLRNGKNKVAVTVFFLLNYYVVCSWSIWWFGGRAMVQSYPILMMPFTALIDVAFSKKWLWAVLTPVYALFSYVAIWFLYQSHGGGLYEANTMTDAYFNRVIGRWSVPPKFKFLKDQTEVFDGTQTSKQLVFETGFENDTANVTTDSVISGTKSILVSPKNKYVTAATFKWSNNIQKWLEISADFKTDHSENDVWKMHELIADFYFQGKLRKTNMIRVNRDIGDWETKRLPMYAHLDTVQVDSVVVKLYFAENIDIMRVDNLKVYSFSE